MQQKSEATVVSGDLEGSRRDHSYFVRRGVFAEANVSMYTKAHVLDR